MAKVRRDLQTIQLMDKALGLDTENSSLDKKMDLVNCEFKLGMAYEILEMEKKTIESDNAFYTALGTVCLFFISFIFTSIFLFEDNE